MSEHAGSIGYTLCYQTTHIMPDDNRVIITGGRIPAIIDTVLFGTMSLE
jgi:hypothetical protein